MTELPSKPTSKPTRKITDDPYGAAILIRRLVMEQGFVYWRRYLTAFASLFLATVIGLELLGFLVSRLLRTVGLGFIDRLLGAIFGLARGVLVAWILTLAGGFTTLPQRDWWRDAVLAPPLQSAVLAARPLLPLELAKRIHYS